MRPLYRIKNWDRFFENSKSRLLDAKKWCAVPNKQDGLGYGRLLRKPNGAALYGAFVAVVLVASKQSMPRQGYLTDTGRVDGWHYDALDLSIKTQIGADIIQQMLDAVSGDDIAWIEKTEETEEKLDDLCENINNINSVASQGHCGTTAVPPECPSTTHRIGEERRGEERRGIKKTIVEFGETKLDKKMFDKPKLEMYVSPKLSDSDAIESRANDEARAVCEVKTTAGTESRANDEARAVYHHWQEKTGHKRARLDKKRLRVVLQRLRDGYTVEDLRLAIDGCLRSPHHMGQNDQQQVYDDLELICRDAGHVDKFIRLAMEPQVSSGLSLAGRQTINSGMSWLGKKLNHSSS